MFLVGLTGGIATGKSTVSRFFLEAGIQVIDADQVAREVVEPGRRALKKIVATFGPSVLDSSGCLNRTAVGEIIFRDFSARQKLNAITHPEICRSILWKCFLLFLTGHHYAILDIPLLFETGRMLPFVRKTIVVKCSEEQQLCRLMERNGLCREDAEARVSAQWPLPKKCALADMVIDNTGTVHETKQQVHCIVEELNRSRAYWKLRLITVFVVMTTTFLLGKGVAVVLRS